MAGSGAPMLRLATLDDAVAVDALIQDSIRGVFPGSYDDRQTEAAALDIDGVDRTMITDGTYYVIEEAGDLIACGGWTRRSMAQHDRHGWADEVRRLDPATEPAHLRSIFVRPDRLRRGLATRILEASEAAAAAEGFLEFELRASCPGVPLYERHGYVVTDRFTAEFSGGVMLDVATMRKRR